MVCLLQDTVGESTRNTRDPLPSYLHSLSQHHFPAPDFPISGIGIRNVPPITPPHSYISDLRMSQAAPSAPGLAQSMPLTPISDSSAGSPNSLVPPADACGDQNCNIDTAQTTIPLLASLFPYYTSHLSQTSMSLEIVTPPDHVLTGFVCDHPTGRTVFVHLPPPHASSNRPEALSGNFSEVLRPHDPSRSPVHQYSSPLDGLDVRESLTALLDLASDSLDAKSLVLALNKDDRELEGLNELLHSLMYAGGQVLPPGKGALDGGWEWDPRKWVLVGLEL